MDRAKAKLLLAIVATVLALDLASKLAVQTSMQLYDRMDVLGSVIRLTYIRNPGAAFGIDLGANSRFIFLGLSLVALAILGALYWYTSARDRIRQVSIALICGGALGNIIDRIRSAAGVVDFLDIGLGQIRWPVFNVADMAVTTGAIVLALSLWQEDRRIEQPG